MRKPGRSRGTSGGSRNERLAWRRSDSGCPRLFPFVVVPADLDPLREFLAPIAVKIRVDTAFFGDNLNERLTHALKLDHQRYRVFAGAIREVNSDFCCAADIALFCDFRFDD